MCCTCREWMRCRNDHRFDHATCRVGDALPRCRHKRYWSWLGNSHVRHLLSTLTVAAALDAGIVKPGTELSTDPLEAVFCEYKLPSDVGRSGESKLTVSNALACSANVVLAKLGILVGREKEYDVLNRFGIGARSGMDFPGESAGRLLPPENWSKVHRVRIPIGQGVECTAMQIARAYATLANHGTLVEPYAVKRIVETGFRPFREERRTPHAPSLKVRSGRQGGVRRSKAFV